MEMQELQDEEINLLEYWNVIWHRKILVISLCFVVVTATMVISLRSPKFYKSETYDHYLGLRSRRPWRSLSALPLAGALGGIGGVQTPADKIMVTSEKQDHY